MKYNYRIILDNINKTMRENNISQADIVKATDIKQTRLSACGVNGKIDSNYTQELTACQLVDILDYLKLSLNNTLENKYSEISPYKMANLGILYKFLFSLSSASEGMIKPEIRIIDDLAYIYFQNENINQTFKEWGILRHNFDSTENFDVIETWQKGKLDYAAQCKLELNYQHPMEYYQKIVFEVNSLIDKYDLASENGTFDPDKYTSLNYPKSHLIDALNFFIENDFLTKAMKKFVLKKVDEYPLIFESEINNSYETL